MHPYPHIYHAAAAGQSTGDVSVTSPSLPDIVTAPPPEFDGPGGRWSPETLLCAAVANCYILTFRGVSRAARFEWLMLDCRVEGTLERVDGQTRFTRFTTMAQLSVRAGVDSGQARKLLERAEQVCLVSNSLSGARDLEISIVESAA
jgi:organic hydroperoxide reductase OsmC/OhrA